MSISRDINDGLSPVESSSPRFRPTDVAAREPTATQSRLVVSTFDVSRLWYDILLFLSAQCAVMTLAFPATASSVEQSASRPACIEQTK